MLFVPSHCRPPLDADRDTTNAIRRQCEGLTLNPTKPQLEETLPEGFTRNYAGYLIKSARKRIHVSKEIVATEEEFLEDYIVVASFLGGKLTPLAFAAWLANLYSHLGSGLVVASDNTRRGFFLPESLQQRGGAAITRPHPIQIGGDNVHIPNVVTGFRPEHEERYVNSDIVKP